MAVLHVLPSLLPVQLHAENQKLAPVGNTPLCFMIPLDGALLGSLHRALLVEHSVQASLWKASAGPDSQMLEMCSAALDDHV